MLLRCNGVWRILPAVGFALVGLRLAHGQTLRIVEYNIDCSDTTTNNNITGAGGTTPGIPAILQGIGNHHLGSNAQPVDVIALTELLDTNNNSITSTTLPALVTALNNIYGAGTYAYDSTPDPTTGGTSLNGPSGLIYNTHTVQVVSAINLPYGSVSGANIPRAPMRYQLQPVGYGSNASFYMYVSHFKSGSATSDYNARGAEGTEIRTNADALGSSAHIIYTGDYNAFGDSSDPGYVALLAAGAGQAHDVMAPGAWSSNTTATSYLYTESTSSLRYRDDMQLVSNATLTQPGLQIARDTSDPFDPRNFPSAKYPYAMAVFGNNGSTAVGASTNLATNTSLNDLANASTIRADLMQPSGSDHLPIFADYNLVGVNPVAQAVAWISGRTGTWSTASNWTPATVPNNAGTLSYAVTINTGNATLSTNTTINSLTMTAGTLAGAGNLTLTSGAISGTFNVTGTTTITSDPITVTPAGTVTFNGTTHNAGAFTGTGNLTVNAGATLTSDSITLNALTINGNLIIRSNGASTSKVNALQLGGASNNWTGSLNLTNNKLIVEDAATHAASLATLQNQVAFGVNGTAGIFSSTLPAGQAIAVIDNAVLNKSSFGGIGVDASSILIAPELLGDANADGTVDLADLSTVFTNFGSTAQAWTSGNFNGDATIDLTDLADVLNNYGVTKVDASMATSVATPEPASLALLSLGTLVLLRRRIA